MSGGLRAKSRQAGLSALRLNGDGDYDGAANRAYYSLYHAFVSRLEADGRRLEDLVSVDRRSRGQEHWPHDVLRNNRCLSGLDREGQRLFAQAQDLRVKADYRPDSVDEPEIAAVVHSLERLLGEMGV